MPPNRVPLFLEVCVTANLVGSRRPVTHTSSANLLVGRSCVATRDVDVLSNNIVAKKKYGTPTFALCPIASAANLEGSKDVDAIAHFPAGPSSFRGGFELAVGVHVDAAADGGDKAVGVYDSVRGSRVLLA